MQPNFKTFRRQYLLMTFLGLLIPSALLSMSLVRNVINITLPELIMGLGMIAVAITFSAVRDSRGYWFYAIQAVKIFEPESERQRLITANIPAWRQLLARSPVFAALLAFIFVVAISAVGYSWSYPHIDALIYLCGFFILPFFSLLLLGSIVICHTREAILNSSLTTGSVKNIYYYLGYDVLISLLVNFALVFPIARKPAFSLADGYNSMLFQIAFCVLLLAVLLFMLFFARVSRRYIMVGELIAEDIDLSFARRPLPSLLAVFLKQHRRYIIYFFSVILWGILLCNSAALLVDSQDFIPLYLLALIPIVLIYLVERYQVLYVAFIQAKDIHQRLKNNKILLSLR